MEVVNSLVDKGNTVLIIEHNLDVIKLADHIIDLGRKVAMVVDILLQKAHPKNLQLSKKVIPDFI